MMINAGISVLAFNGQQSYNEAQGIWNNIGINVVYPSGQNASNNPGQVGDVVIEPNGNAWTIVNVVSQVSNTLTVNLAPIGFEPTEDIAPDMGVTTRGAIVTPLNGVIVPYWDASIVDAAVYRSGLGKSNFDGLVNNSAIVSLKESFEAAIQQ